MAALSPEGKVSVSGAPSSSPPSAWTRHAVKIDPVQTETSFWITYNHEFFKTTPANVSNTMRVVVEFLKSVKAGCPGDATLCKTINIKPNGDQKLLLEDGLLSNIHFVHVRSPAAHTTASTTATKDQNRHITVSIYKHSEGSQYLDVHLYEKSFQSAKGYEGYTVVKKWRKETGRFLEAISAWRTGIERETIHLCEQS